MNLKVTTLLMLLLTVVSVASSQQLVSPNQSVPLNNSAVNKQRVLRQIDLKEATIVDAARMISELSGMNVVATAEAGKKEVTLYLQNVRAIDAVETVARVAGLWFREDESTGTVRIMTTDEYKDDIIIRRDDITKVFTLLHPNAMSVASAIQDLYGQRVRLNIRSIDDDLLLQQGALISSQFTLGGGLGGGGFGGGVGGGLGGQGGGVGRARFAQRGFGGGGFGGGFGGGGFGGGGFGGGGFGGGGFGGGGFGGGGFGGGAFGGNRNFNQNQGQSIREQLLDGNLSAEQLARIERSLAGQGQDGTVSSSDVSEAAQKEQVIYVTLNRSHNLVIVRTGDKDAMKAIERLINEIDRPTPQVLLEMKILDVRLDDNFRSIFDIQFNNGPQGPSAGQQGANNPFVQSAASAAENVLGLGNFPVEGGTFIYQFLNDNIRARIELLQTNGRIETVATPLLLASNNRPARIFVGEERVLVRSVNSTVVTPSVGAATTGISPVTELVDIGTNLFILPKINADRTVTLIVNQDNSTVKVGGATIPVSGQNGAVTEFPIDTVDTANVSGTVVARDGLSVAIGGLVRETIVENEQKVPVVGNLPVLGFPFRRTVRTKTKSELVLIITPHVITTPIEGQQRTMERVQTLSDSCYGQNQLMQDREPGPNQPWTPQRLENGYRRTVGEKTNYSGAQSNQGYVQPSAPMQTIPLSPRR